MLQSIDYQKFMQQAMLKLIQNVLSQVAEHGLPGEHYFYIVFDTMHPDVEVADWLSDRYPGEMTIVIQNWFSNLDVSDEGFSITLNFDNSPNTLYIPYDSLISFTDPSTSFGISFQQQEKPDIEYDSDLAHFPNAPKGDDTDDDEAPMLHVAQEDELPRKDAEIVSLDKFRR